MHSLGDVTEVDAVQTNLQTSAPTGQDEVDALAPWFHNLHLPDGRQTAPRHPLGDFPRFKWEQICPHLPLSLEGWTGLDIGCNAGFYTFSLAARGAAMLGVDVDAHYLRQAEWAATQMNVSPGTARFEQRGVYELARLQGTFDLVWFMGVFYHLRYPLLGLDIAASKARRLFVFQSLTSPEAAASPGSPAMPDDLEFADRARLADPRWPKMAFIEHRFAGDHTNWWAPTAAAVEAMLRSAGLEIIARPAEEIYICRPQDPRQTSAAIRYERSCVMRELGDATGVDMTGSAPA